MTKQIRFNRMVAAIGISIGAVHASAGTVDDQTLSRQLTDSIAKVRTGKNVTVRTEAAQHLADLTEKLDSHTVDDKTILDMVSLLDSSEDSVRFWVAAALGFLGSRAKTAAPKLLKLLPEADRLQGDLTSAPAIRLALTRIGVTPPPDPNHELTKK